MCVCVSVCTCACLYVCVCVFSEIIKNSASCRSDLERSGTLIIGLKFVYLNSFVNLRMYVTFCEFRWSVLKFFKLKINEFDDFAEVWLPNVAWQRGDACQALSNVPTPAKHLATRQRLPDTWQHANACQALGITPTPAKNYSSEFSSCRVFKNFRIFNLENNGQWHQYNWLKMFRQTFLSTCSNQFSKNGSSRSFPIKFVANERI